MEVHLAALDLEFIRLERFRLERAPERGLRGLGEECDVELRAVCLARLEGIPGDDLRELLARANHDADLEAELPADPLFDVPGQLGGAPYPALENDVPALHVSLDVLAAE